MQSATSSLSLVWKYSFKDNFIFQTNSLPLHRILRGQLGRCFEPQRIRKYSQTFSPEALSLYKLTVFLWSYPVTPADCTIHSIACWLRFYTDAIKILVTYSAPKSKGCRKKTLCWAREASVSHPNENSDPPNCMEMMLCFTVIIHCRYRGFWNPRQSRGKYEGNLISLLLPLKRGAIYR